MRGDGGLEADACALMADGGAGAYAVMADWGAVQPRGAAVKDAS
jgi:hypothetical protein